MIWLASFPRSGNTFFRNVLFEVYGLKSSAYHKEKNRRVNEKYATFPFVKTHLLPSDLPEEYKNEKSVYITRDGRDALVSIAHHRKDVIEKGSPFYSNLLEAILAPENSYFGGWSRNVQQWTTKADIVIRFEDLIADPIAEIEKLREIVDLPPPNKDKLPDFKRLKFGQPKYSGHSATKHFRKGKIGGWKDDMSAGLHRLFWDLHGEQMLENGYMDNPLSQRHDWLKIINQKSRSFHLKLGRKLGLF